MRECNGGDGGESNSSRGSIRECLDALVPTGTGPCCPLLSNGVDLPISALLSLLLSCFWWMQNRRASDYLHDNSVVASQGVQLLFTYQMILLHWVYWLCYLHKSFDRLGKKSLAHISSFSSLIYSLATAIDLVAVSFGTSLLSSRLLLPTIS